MDIKILPLPPEKMKPKYSDESKLGFGKLFTDRMLIADWNPTQGWHDARIQPYQPFIMDPACTVLHYAQEIFEGLKAYKWKDESVVLFRPDMNLKRLNRSAERLCMPQVPEELFIKGIEELVRLEKDWIPTSPGTALYVRPTMIAVDPFLGVHPSESYCFYVILSPVGAYYTSGFQPVKIMVEDKYVRAAQGGTGEAKTGANYASSLKAGLDANNKGYEQVLWLDGAEKRYIEEVGSMNMFFVYGDTIVTPALDGSILHGITRDSVIALAKKLGYAVEEKKIDVNILIDDIKSGKTTEAFGSGTAAVISPVDILGYKEEALTIGNGRVGKVTQKLYDALTGIQSGAVSDQFGWITKL
ncbi:MAG: branched-chain amino acid aminotransferase [Desulfuromonadales bacterium]|nr:branched-chain amino acid aminotransferase [Desulfuromonadales bacterium]